MHWVDVHSCCSPCVLEAWLTGWVVSGTAKLYRDLACLPALLLCYVSRFQVEKSRSHLTRHRLTPSSSNMSRIDVNGLRAVNPIFKESHQRATTVSSGPKGGLTVHTAAYIAVTMPCACHNDSSLVNDSSVGILHEHEMPDHCSPNELTIT